MAPPTASVAAPIPFADQVRGLPRAFWMLNVMEMFERLAYYGVRVVIPVYIAQADLPGGLHFTQAQKGTIFLWWALVQTLVPLFSGGFADRYGYKKTIAVSIGIKILGYLLMATQREFWPFLASCCVLAFGTAIFKPGVQGSLVRSTDAKTSSVAWGIFYMVVNVGGFLGPPLAGYLKGYSWATTFYGCAIIVSLNFLMLLTYPEVESGASRSEGAGAILRKTVVNLLNPRLVAFILIFSGFWLMFMQLFDMLPNFIVDWVDSSALAASLPAMFVEQTPRGAQVAQEWMINLDALLICLFVVSISAYVARLSRLTSIVMGMVVATIGLVMAGLTTSATFCLGGIAVFSLGEMLASPKMNEYLGVIAPPDQKGLYMGYANVPLAFGWGTASKLGGWAYGQYGEKATLALRYLAEHTRLGEGLPKGADWAARSDELPGLLGVTRADAVTRLGEVLGQGPAEVTRLLWDAYHPYQVWYLFGAIGLLTAVLMVGYHRAAERWANEPR